MRASSTTPHFGSCSSRLPLWTRAWERSVSSSRDSPPARVQGRRYVRDSKCQWPEVRGHSWLSMGDGTNESLCPSAPPMDGHRDGSGVPLMRPPPTQEGPTGGPHCTGRRLPWDGVAGGHCLHESPATRERCWNLGFGDLLCRELLCRARWETPTGSGRAGTCASVLRGGDSRLDQLPKPPTSAIPLWRLRPGTTEASESFWGGPRTHSLIHP